MCEDNKWDEQEKKKEKKKECQFLSPIGNRLFQSFIVSDYCIPVRSGLTKCVTKITLVPKV